MEHRVEQQNKVDEDEAIAERMARNDILKKNENARKEDALDLRRAQVCPTVYL